MFNPLDKFFDINKDGKLDALEKAGKAWVITSILDDIEKEDDSDDDNED